MSITLEHIQEQLRPELDKLNEIIVTTLTSNSDLTNGIVTNYLKTKGKMLRPIVTLLSAKFFGGINEKALQGAAAIEMLHNASLIHDDVIDQARERRGVPPSTTCGITMSLCLWETSLSQVRCIAAWPRATGAS